MITRSVTIPSRVQHEGWYKVTVILEWKCPTCGKDRGKVLPTISYDGSRRLGCDGWENPCGHVDKYEAVLAEAINNGLNNKEVQS